KSIHLGPGRAFYA
nr:Chain P, Envelope glycoprotein [Human immunodeficiency virus 1]3C2A_Q Chain Q, Envelope glycoprotein [Human immunodeficiency virus 1]